MGDHRAVRAVRGWPVQTRLLAVIVLALLMGLLFGGLRVADGVGEAEQYGQASRLARLGEQAVVLTGDLENERDQTAGVIAGASPAPLRSLTAATDAQAARVRGLAGAIGPGFPANIVSDARAVSTATTDLPSIRAQARLSGSPANVLSSYADPVNALIQLEDQIAQGISDSALVDEVRTLTELEQAQEAASQQRALLYYTLLPAAVAPDAQTSLSSEMAQEQSAENAFRATATPAELAGLDSVLGSPQAITAVSIEQLTLSNSPFSALPDTDPAVSPAAQWYSVMSAKITGLQDAALGIARETEARTAALQAGAVIRTALTAAGLLAVLLLVLAAAVVVARSLVWPLEQLRAGALEIATVDLPERVRRLGESGGEEAVAEVTPIAVTDQDEIGQVARAFDQVHREAVRLAGTEAMLRASFNATFLNLSRRLQVLIERLARQIDSLEQNEEDPGLLAELFSMDHLVTRMRRNSENLLLIAGHEGSRRRGEAAPLSDVARAAASEIEDYGRVTVLIGHGTSVAGQAVGDIARLLAELIENAAAYSPSESKVYVSARELAEGGVVVEVADLGVGISAARLAELNARLDDVPEMDAWVARHMGLFAVARLARRHGARVRLREGSPRGVTALVWLPDSILEPTPDSVPLPTFTPAPKPAPAPAPAPGSPWFRSHDGGQTAAGLPLRVPNRPERARSRLSGFQSGAHRAKSKPGGGEGESR